MAVVSITFEDLTPFTDSLKEDKAEAMIEDTLARAKLLAPCISEDSLTPDGAAAVKGILRRVILRWNDAGTGAITQQTQSAGAFSQSHSIDNRDTSKVLFFPSEITELQNLCRDNKARRGKAFSIDMGMAGYGSALQPNLWE